MSFLKYLPLVLLMGCGYVNRNQYCLGGATGCTSSSDSASTASVPIINGALSVANKTREGLTMNWPQASDASTPQNNLTYQLVYSENLSDLDTVTKALNMVNLGYGSLDHARE